LSLALEIYLTVEVEVHDSIDRSRVIADGVDSEKMPEGGDNLILRVMEAVAQRRGRRVEPVVLKVQNEIPLARGLGSSSTAILAGISCYEIVTGDSLSESEIFSYAMEFEPHPDNLAAGLLGGLTVSTVNDSGKAMSSKLTVSKGVTPVLVIPEFELSTEKARDVLPASYSRQDAVFNIQRASLMVAALTGGHWSMLSEAMRDRLHQPYRARLVPGFEAVLRMKAEGLFGIALSGAGPAVLAFAAPEAAAFVGERIVAVFESNGVTASARVSSIDTEGRCFLPH